MIYLTDVIAQTVTSEAGLRALDYLSPVYGEATNFLAILDAVGYDVDDLCDWAQSFVDQATPDTATWAIPYWEAEYGLIGDAGESAERRAERVLGTIRAKGPASPYRLEQAIKAATGLDVEIVEAPGTLFFGVRIQGANHNLAGLRAILDRRKPAHLQYTTIYKVAVPGAIYAGGLVRTYKKTTLRQ